jgi:L-lactate utilization protein LutB
MESLFFTKRINFRLGLLILTSILFFMYDEMVAKFKSKNIDVVQVKNKKEASEFILKMIPNGSKIGYGGSVTLEQVGVLEKIKTSDFVLFDRSKVFMRNRDGYELAQKALLSDFFLSGANAVTLDGKIVNRDKYGNRVGAQIFGPEHVIIVVGKNKIVKNLEEAIKRIENVAAPLNTKRLNLKTPCVQTGKCMDCSSPERICYVTTIIEGQAKPGRMTLIIVDEDLGF